MITAAQLRAARALLALDQRTLADLSGLSVPTIQRMEASNGVIRGNVDSLMKLIGALEEAGGDTGALGAATSGVQPTSVPTSATAKAAEAMRVVV